jgi:hypothetical protein
MNKINEKYFEHKIHCYRHLFTVFSAITIGCAAWFVSNYGKTYKEFIFLDTLVIVIASVALVLTAAKVRKYIKLSRE